MLDFADEDFEAVERTLDTIKSRWPEASAADLLEAQLALARDDMIAAGRCLDRALAKDPSNKVALFWKAQIDERTGAKAAASSTYEQIVRDQPIKQLSEGLSLSTAAQWALANAAIDRGEYDRAIELLDAMIQADPDGPLTRIARWKRVAARAAKGQWEAAKAEIIGLLKEPKATLEERVEAANLFRVNGEPKLAGALVAQVLEHQPDNTGANVISAFLLKDDGKAAEAADALGP